MKKILIFIALFCFASNGSVEASESITHRGTTIEVTRKQDSDNKFKLFIEGTGEHLFTHIYGDDHANRYNVETVEVEHDLFFVKGFIVNREIQTYNPYLIAMTHEGDIVYEVVFDSGYEESIDHVFYYDDYLVLHVNRSKYNEETKGIDHVDDRFVKLQDGSIVETIVIDDPVNYIENNDGNLLLKSTFSGNPQNMILNDFSVVEEDMILGFLDGETYYDTVTLYFLGEVIIDQKAYTAPLVIDKIGEYTINFQDQDYAFTLHPKIEGISHNMVTNQVVEIDYDYLQAKVNGYLYHANTPISEPGNYEFSIEDNDYKYTMHFTITSDLKGVYNNQSYDHAKRITFNGDGYLNNQYFESGNIIEEDGTYTLKIYGNNDYEEVHHFKIDKAENESSLNHLKVIELSLLAGALFIGGYLLFGFIKKK